MAFIVKTGYIHCVRSDITTTSKFHMLRDGAGRGGTGRDGAGRGGGFAIIHRNKLSCNRLPAVKYLSFELMCIGAGTI